MTFKLLKSVDNYQVEVLLTLAAVIGGYALATRLHVSGPLAMVVAGLIIGNHGRARAMSDTTRRYLDMFWEIVDEILNALLFVLIGMEVLLIDYTGNELVATGVAIVVTLLARLLTVGLPVRLLHQLSRLAAWLLEGAVVGGAARRHIGRAGTVAAARPGARHGDCIDLRRGGVLDSRAGPVDWRDRAQIDRRGIRRPLSRSSFTAAATARPP